MVRRAVQTKGNTVPTIEDVASAAGVSVTTVSRVINDVAPVKEETRRRVKAAIEELRYRPSLLAQGMRGQTTRSVGVLIPDFRSAWYAELMKYIEDEARSHGYLAVTCSTEVDSSRELDYIRDLASRQVDGLILCWYRETPEKMQLLNEVAHTIPVIMMDRPAEGYEASGVYTEGREGIHKLTRAFIRQGHRRIGMVVEDRSYPEHQRRFEGYLQALEEGGIRPDDRLIVNAGVGLEAGHSSADELLTGGRPTAIITGDDLTAIGILRYCRERSIDVPREVSVTGFDNTPLSRYSVPSLTTVAQPVRDLARSAIEQIMRKLKNKRSRNREIVYQPTVILRESTTLREEDLD
jgi:LacI family transcriptional regulator